MNTWRSPSDTLGDTHPQVKVYVRGPHELAVFKDRIYYPPKAQLNVLPTTGIAHPARSSKRQVVGHMVAQAFLASGQSLGALVSTCLMQRCDNKVSMRHWKSQVYRATDVLFINYHLSTLITWYSSCAAFEKSIIKHHESWTGGWCLRLSFCVKLGYDRLYLLWFRTHVDFVRNRMVRAFFF